MALIMKVLHFLWFSVIIFSFQLFAQYKIQTLKLHSGWNSVFLEVQPKPADCAVLFSGVPEISRFHIGLVILIIKNFSGKICLNK
ncbi:MAG: hypothetical protein DRI44_03090 [Chlamydiae bacterium]|nr:MAG: hypothetical protein DRI44_03090 [Chlamydiota bacterium]